MPIDIFRKEKSKEEAAQELERLKQDRVHAETELDLFNEVKEEQKRLRSAQTELKKVKFEDSFVGKLSKAISKTPEMFNSGLNKIDSSVKGLSNSPLFKEPKKDMQEKKEKRDEFSIL